MAPSSPRSFRDFVRHFNSHDAHPLLQFVKYGISGGIASAVHLFVFFLVSWWIFPALTPNDPFVRGLAFCGIAVPTPAMGDALRSNRVMLDNTIAFLFSNSVAYLLNILWVFRRGRHGWLKELLLFFAVSGLSIVVGTLLAGGLVRWTGMATTFAFAANVAASVAINYGARKYFVFQG